MRLMSLDFVLFVLPGFLIGLTVHEFAHAWSASLLGDDYPRRRGRVSLNPFRHLSLLGTLVILVFPIGWAKPVEVNIYNFKRPKRDFLLTSLAGPAANLLLAAACLLAMQFTRRSFRFGLAGQPGLDLAHALLGLGALINMILAALNLLPIPPLDGSKIWPCLLPRMKLAQKRGTTWLFILVLVALVWTGSLGRMIDHLIGPAARLIPETDSMRCRRHIRAGIRALRKDRLDEAEHQLDQALALNGRSHEALSWRAKVRAARKDYRAAAEDILKAIELHPGSADYHLQAGDYFGALGLEDEARKFRDAAAAIRPGATSKPTSAPATRAATRPAALVRSPLPRPARSKLRR